MRRAFAPSTSLTAVWAATTPSSPGLNSGTTSSLSRPGVRTVPGIHVDVEPDRRHPVLDLVLDGHRDVVCLGERGACSHLDVQHRDQLATHPARTHVVDAEDTLDARRSCGDLLDHLGI